MSKKKKNRNNRHDVEYQEKDHSKYYLWIIKAGIIVCLFLPLLMVYSHIYVMQVGKTLAFRIIIEAVAFFYLILIIKKEEYRPKWGLFEISITTFLAIYLLTSLTGINFLRSFWGTAERMGGFFTMLHFWLYFIILVSVFRTRKDWVLLFGVSICVSVVSSLYAFGQSAFFWRTVLPWIGLKNIVFHDFIQKYITEKNFITVDNWRPFGTIGNAGLFTAYILYNFFFALYLFLFCRKRAYKVFAFLTTTAIFAVLVVAGSRSSFLAIVAGIIAFNLAFLSVSGRMKTKVAFSVIAVLIISVSTAIWMNKNETWVKNNYIFDRIASISIQSGEMRTMTWESSWKGYLDSPVLGVGPENYNIVFNKYFNPLHFTGYESVSWYDKAHNIFLDILTTMGVVGLISFLGIFAIMYWFLIKNKYKLRENLPAFALIMSFPVAYFVQNMFWFDDFSSYLMLFLFFAFVSNFFNEELKFEYNLERGRKITDKIIKTFNLKNLEYWIDENKKIFLYTFGIFLILTIYYENIKAWKFHDLTTVAVAAFSQNADDSFLWYREAMKNSTYLGRQELYKRFGNYVNAKYIPSGKEETNDREIFKQNLKFAILEMENAVKENEKDAQFYSLLGAIYNKYYSNFREGEYIGKAEETLKKAIELSPERETVYYEYGQTMIFKKDYKKAIEFFKKGVDLNPPVPVSHWYLGMAYLNADDYKSADAEINEAIKLGYEYKTVKDILNIAPIYIELKDYRRLEELYKDVLELDPDNAEVYASLALVYKELGDNISAKNMAERAISIDETFKTEGEKFIESLKK